jgi:hypothetical protein
MNNKYYIYAHTIASHGGDRPFGEIFYIGKGSGKRAYIKGNMSQYWKNIVSKYEYNIHYFETKLTNEQANLAEIRYIKAIGREDLGLGTLVNHSDGGESGSIGCVWSEESRKKQSESHKGEKAYWFGKEITDEAKKKMSDAKIGFIPWIKDKHHSEETKTKMRGKIISLETRKKMSDSHIGLIPHNKGKTYEEIYGEEKSKLLKKQNSELHKGQISYMKGKHHSEESKKKNREAQPSTKEYSFIDEKGNIFKGKSIKKFSIENGYHQGHLGDIMLGKAKSHKGLRIYERK